MILNVHPKEILHQPLATAWSVLEGARLANVDPTHYVSSRQDTDEINRLKKANCSIWASKELLMYVKLQEQNFSGVKKIALLADGSSFNGENWQAGIIWSWEKELGAIALCQVWGESYLIHTFSVGIGIGIGIGIAIRSSNLEGSPRRIRRPRSTPRFAHASC